MLEHNIGNGFEAVDFFCGAGGTTRGLLDAGMKVLAGIDSDAKYRATFVSNNANPDGTPVPFIELDLLPKGPGYPAGQRDEVIEELRRLVPREPSRRAKPLLFAFCPPCQPFTSVNRGKLSPDMAEARRKDRNLLYHSLGYILEFRPEAILCENVAGIRDRKYGGVWQNFEAAVAKAGYLVGSDVVDTSLFGIAQTRRRSIMIAVRSDAFRRPDTADDSGTHLVVPQCDPSSGRMTVRDAIGHLPPLAAGATDPADPDHRASRVSDINRKRLEAAPEGGTNEHFNGTDLEVGCHTRLRERLNGMGRTSGGYTDAYTRLYADRPAPTVTTRCFSFSNGRFGHYDRSQNRALSIREAACLQSFPDGYRFQTDSISAAANMVGNAMPPKLAEFFGRHLALLTRVEH